jgi:hypothetical protein
MEAVAVSVGGHTPLMLPGMGMGMQYQAIMPPPGMMPFGGYLPGY